MQSCHVPLLVRKYFWLLIHRNSKSSGRPLLGFMVPWQPALSQGLVLFCPSDELSEEDEESLDESVPEESEESLDELDSFDESEFAILDFLRSLCFLRFCSFLARFFAFAFAFFFFSSSRCFLFLAFILQESSAIPVEFHDDAPNLLCHYFQWHLLRTVLGH